MSTVRTSLVKCNADSTNQGGKIIMSAVKTSFVVHSACSKNDFSTKKWVQFEGGAVKKIMGTIRTDLVENS